MKKTYFQICPRCGATLDPGERCECEKELDALREKEQPVRVIYGIRKRPLQRA